MDNEGMKAETSKCGALSEVWKVESATLREDSQIPMWKRGLDLACILAAVPVLIPVSLALAGYVKASSAGPVLFKQVRVGLREKRFVCFKFRTMKVGSDTNVHQAHLEDLIKNGRPMVKMDTFGDSRLIPFGSILRATGLDELPQLINIIRGEMSLVGPRPCTLYEFDQYLPWQRERFDAAPGLTGYWQVNGKNKTTFAQMVQMDIYYARNRALWLDVKILFKTIPALLRQVWEMISASREQGTR